LFSSLLLPSYAETSDSLFSLFGSIILSDSSYESSKLLSPPVKSPKVEITSETISDTVLAYSSGNYIP